MTDLGGRLGEREMLNGFLDWYRAVVANKVRDLSLHDATRVMTASGLSPLRVVSHLTGVEYGWFDEKFLGNPLRVELGNRLEFHLDDTDAVDSVIAVYREACAHSRQVVADAPSLDQVGALTHRHFGAVTLRWILVHMIDETARHAGHLDLMREQIDGRTGD